jgi:hypothetical protein
MFSMMGIAIVILTLWTAYIGVLFFTESKNDLPDYYIWSLRFGIFFFVIFALQGGMMGSRLSHTVGAPDGSKGLPFTNWSLRFGDLRVAHFFGMHALQIIPLVSFYLIQNLLGTIAFAMIYFIICTLILLQALNRKPFIKI